ncbi:tetratricopeptide repeat protein [Ottowia thiooxydans]|uniref:tetratricopeptide repeat protein n=1 Tax=Ottowia thiooxydans TaxID=219182 RepID=UPI000410D686|nr:tetratricopeptide repeat protein [Ottowia thiooxydans]
MQHFFRFFPLITLIPGLAIAQATAPAQPASAPAAQASAAAPAPTPGPSALTARLLYELLIGEISFREGSTQGIELMLDAARRTADPALYKRAVEMAIQSRSGTMALDAVRAWRRAEPQSVDANRMELQVLVALGRIEESDVPLAATLAALPANEQEAFITAVPSLYARVPNKGGALQVVERGFAAALKNNALAPAAWTSIGRMRLAVGDNAGAVSAATLGQAANAGSEWPALLGLQLMGGAGQTGAEALVQRYLREASPKPEVQIGYARALLDSGRGQQAREQLADLTRRQPNYPEGWLAQGLLLAEGRYDKEAETSLNRYLQLAEKTPEDERTDRANGLNQARLSLAQIAERKGNFAEAESLLAGITAADEKMTVQLRRASIIAKQGRLEEARQLVRSIPVTRPEDERMKLAAEAQLLRDNKQPQQAYELLKGELAKKPEDEDLLYDTAMAAERVGLVDEMERLLRKVIELKPDSQSAYNALGYTLAERNMRLPEAKQLIETAVKLAPDDPFIQDSLAWVEFRLGRHAEALRILTAAFAKRPDAEIAAHLGEVLWTMGRQDEAKSVWQEGLRLAADNETLQETLKRLQVSL